MQEKVIAIDGFIKYKGKIHAFYAGIIAKDGKVIKSAPILRFMIGWNGKQVSDYCKNKNWKICHTENK